jgi:hypothetical protein
MERRVQVSCLTLRVTRKIEAWVDRPFWAACGKYRL